jgi:hypothetical protein
VTAEERQVVQHLLLKGLDSPAEERDQIIASHSVPEEIAVEVRR